MRVVTRFGEAPAVGLAETTKLEREQRAQHGAEEGNAAWVRVEGSFRETIMNIDESVGSSRKRTKTRSMSLHFRSFSKKHPS